MKKKLISLVVSGIMAQAVNASGPDLQSLDSARVRHPNIIYIMSDDHALGAVSSYGHKVGKLAPTPNIDRIARNGVRFENSFVNNSLCGPSRATMFTGKFSHINGFAYNGQVFDGTQDTWINTLQNNGYTTAAIGKWHINLTPDGFKFDHWEVLNDQGEYYNPDWITKDGVTMEEGYTTDQVTEKTITWLDKQRDTSKPFALIMHHKAPHRNWMPAPEYTRLFENVEFPVPENYFDDYEGRVAAERQTMNIYRDAQEGHDLKMTTGVGETEWREDIWPHLLARLTPEQRAEWDAAYQKRNDDMNANEDKWTEEEIAIWKYQRYMQDYLATIRSVDDSVGEVLDYLEANNLFDNTIVVYTSDQGFYMGEHGWFDKRFMYEQSFQTPLVMQYPAKIKSGTVVNELVQNIDYAPTFLDYAGVTPYEGIQGESLAPVIAGEAEDWRTSLYYHFYEDPAMHDVGRHYGVRDDRYKLIHFYFNMDEWEFYDLENDPQEMNNAINDPQYADEIKRLKGELVKLQDQYDVAPMEEWRNAPLHRKAKPTLQELYPDSYDENGKVVNVKRQSSVAANS